MRRAWRIAGLALGAVCLVVYGAFFFDWETTRTLLARVDVTGVALSVAAFGLTLALRGLKWTYLLRRTDAIPWTKGVHVLMVSNLFNFVFPVRLGEVVKLYLVKRAGEVDYSSSISATLTDRLSSMATILLCLLLLAPAAGFGGLQDPTRLALFAVPFGALLVLVFVAGERTVGAGERLVRRFFAGPGRSSTRLRPLAEEKLLPFVRDTLDKTQLAGMSWTDLAAIAGFSGATLALDGLCWVLLLGAFGLPLGWLQGLVGACFMNLLFVLPTPPGQVGTAEMFPVAVFSLGLGLADAGVASAALLWHLLSGAVLALAGVVSGVALGVDWSAPMTLAQETSLDEPGSQRA